MTLYESGGTARPAIFQIPEHYFRAPAGVTFTSDSGVFPTVLRNTAAGLGPDRCSPGLVLGTPGAIGWRRKRKAAAAHAAA